MSEHSTDATSLSAPMRRHIDGLLTLRSKLAERHGLTLSEADALDHLAEAGLLTPSQLATRLRLTSGSVSALLDRLERFGYARREPSPGDRRKVLVRPTPAGVHAANWSWRQMDRALTAIMLRMEVPLTRERIGELLTVSGQAMTEHARQLPAAPGRSR